VDAQLKLFAHGAMTFIVPGPTENLEIFSLGKVVVCRFLR
jgi:hypothetical protein